MIPVSPAVAALTPGMPVATRGAWIAALARVVDGTRINTVNRMAMFLGQCAEESGSFTVLTENLTYSTRERLCEVYPKHFPTPAVAAPYVYNPVLLANTVYANELGNGPVQSGDGWRYRGRGLIQITGRSEIEACHAALRPGLSTDDFLAWMATPDGASQSAVWWWLWPEHGDLLAPSDAWDIPAVTRIVNGRGMGNMVARTNACNRARSALLPDSIPVATPASKTLAGESQADALMDRELAGLPLAGRAAADVPGGKAEFGA